MLKIHLIKCSISITLFLFLFSGTLCAQVPKKIYEEGYQEIKKLFEQAVLAKDIKICEELLKENAYYINEVDKNGYTQLHYAAMSGQTELCRLFLEHGAKPDIVSKKTSHEGYFTPLEAAIVNDETETALLLIKSVAPDSLKAVRGRNHSPIFHAIENENLEILKALIAKGADVNAPEMIRNVSETPLYFACAVENPDIVKILLEAGADVNQTKNKIKTTNPIFISAMSWNEELCQLLIDSKIDLKTKNASGGNVLHHLLEYFKPMVSYDLADPFAKSSPFILNVTHKSVVMPRQRPENSDAESVESIPGNNLSIFQRFVKAGADVNARDKNGCSVLKTLIISQIQKSRSEEEFSVLLDTLISTEADLNAQDKNGWTVLHYYLFYSLLDRSEYKKDLKEEEIKAIADKKMSVFRKLVEAGADVKLADEKGNTLLHYAVRAPHFPLTKGPLSIDLNYETRNKHQFYTRQLLEYLLEKGIPFSQENKEGKTPMDWAMQGENAQTPSPVPRSSRNRSLPAMEPSAPSEAVDMLMRF